MAIYLDSAKLDEAHKVKEFGWVFGVTTNPSLLAKAGNAPEAVLKQLTGLGFKQVYYQLTAQSLDVMLDEAKSVRKIVGDILVLKIVPTELGFRFVALHGKEFPCCVTAVFSPAQALVAREAGARYVALYVNRATQQMGDGLALVNSVRATLGEGQTEILAASLKSAEEAVAALNAGAQHITVPFNVLASLTSHPISIRTIEQFNSEGIGISLKV